MTSFELFKLLKFKKICISFIFSNFVLLKYIICDKLHQFMKKFEYFASNDGKIIRVIIKLFKKAVEKRKWAGLKNLICINFKCLL